MEHLANILQRLLISKVILYRQYLINLFETSFSVWDNLEDEVLLIS